MEVIFLRRLRDVFYINTFPENKEIVYYGMTFEEFIKYAPVEINKLLLLKAEYFGTEYSRNTGLEILDKADKNDFDKEDVYRFGDFGWVDINDIENVEKLNPLEISELLYLGHMFKPLKSPFFEKIENRYAYLSHDDGWFCKLYCRYYEDYQEIIANKIIDTVSTNKRRKIYPLSKDLKKQLINLAIDGLLIDFNNIFKDGKVIQVPIYIIGKFTNMDEMYNDLNRHISCCKYSLLA
jgi:hypothetical protein